MVGKTPSAHAICRSGPATAQVGVGCTKCNNMQLQPCITTTDKIVVSTGIVGVIAAAINTTCVRVATAFNYSMPLCKLHWLLHHSLQHAPMLATILSVVVVVVAVVVHLVHLVHHTPTYTVAGSEPATCAGGVFPSAYWRTYSTCTCCGHDSLQLALVVLFLKPFVQILYFHLCNLHCVVV